MRDAGKVASDKADALGQKVSQEPWKYGHLLAAAISIIILLSADLARPGSLARAGLRKLTEHTSLTWLLCGVLVFGAQVVGGGFATMLPAAWQGEAGSVKQQAMLQGASYLASLVTAFVLLRILANSAKGAGLGISARGIAWGVVGFLLAWPIVVASGIGFVAAHEAVTKGEIASKLGHPTLALLVENQSSPYAWIVGVCAILGAPIVEEIIYRGFVQSAAHRFTGSPWAAIILSSLVFTGVHVIPRQVEGAWVFPVPWYSAATVGVLGLCCGIAFERTKELGVPIMMHVLFNFTNVALALLTVRPA